ncbi:MAG TPA: ferritin family protein, partial [Candidatus Competibacter sp.]|nr:ferritin family protein [Candidatus Competibacter sp.]
HQALTLVLACEERAEAFFAELAESTSDPAVREMAVQFAAEEKQHAELLKEWLARYPEPKADWWQDLDDPVAQE